MINTSSQIKNRGESFQPNKEHLPKNPYGLLVRETSSFPPKTVNKTGMSSLTTPM